MSSTNINIRTEVKIHENTPVYKISFDPVTKNIIEVDSEYKTKKFITVPVKNIVYDDHVVSCYYTVNNHPLHDVLGVPTLKFLKAFYRVGFVSVVTSNIDKPTQILILSGSNLKHFKH